MADFHQSGKDGELLAAKFLISRGYFLLDSNPRNQFGELDLVMKQGKQLVIVEVKTRTNHSYGHPLEQITSTKIKRLLKAINFYLIEKGWSNQWWRLDFVAVDLSSNPPKIHHLENITI